MDIAHTTQETLGLMKDSLSKAVTLATGLTAYDLQAPAKNLYPIITPLRNALPRVGRINPGDAARWRTISAIAGSGYESMGWVPEGQRTASMSYSAALQGEGWDYALLAYARTTRRSYGPLEPPTALARALGLNLRHWHKSLLLRRWARAVENNVAVVSVAGFTSFPVFTVRGLPDAQGHVPVTILRAPVTLPALTAAITVAQAPPGP